MISNSYSLEHKVDKRTEELKDEIKVRAQLEAQLFQAQKMESLGVLAGGVAHDFNNLLMPLVGYVDLIRNRISGDPETSGYLDSIQLSGEKLANLCNQMLIYSGGGHFVKTVIDIKEQIIEVQDLVRAAIPSSFRITYHIENGVPAVKADATQFNQVLMNLLINASEAMDPNQAGTITVSTGQTYLDSKPEKTLHFGESINPGNYVYVEIQDEGVGISEENQSRLFDPFFTTKFTGRGLGMAVVFGIVKAHMGAVDIHSKIGIGTTIRAYFPATEDAITQAKNTKQTKLFETTTLNGRILVVDDEPDVRALMRRMLQKMGFEVVEAEDGAKGLEIFCQEKQEI